MIESFRQLINRLRDMPRQRVCAAPAGNKQVLQAVRDALDEGIAGALLVGHQDHIWRMACQVSLNLNRVELIHEPDPRRAVSVAAGAVKSGAADVLMKGEVNSGDFLRAAASPEGLGNGTLLSYLAAFEVPGYDRLIYVTDGGLNTSPDFTDKAAILQNAIAFLHRLGIETPKVALLSANEKVSPKMPVTVEARRLVDMARQGAITGALVEGPMALDVAVSREAARQKGITDSVASRADLLFAPSIEAGSFLGQAILHFARGRMAAVVLGARKPVVLAGRNETPRGRVCSLALACYAAARAARMESGKEG
ncbi:MAG: phosphate butyryltransferase [Peptococcaceae bacterium]|nr:phosphate butyryltransferase [Peptococcaceae bacterium]